MHERTPMLVQGLLSLLRISLQSNLAVQEFFSTSIGVRSIESVVLSVAVFHGVVGQLFFCLLVAIVLFTTLGWQEKLTAQKTHHARTSQVMCSCLAGMVFLQLVLGSIYRHSRASFWFLGHVIVATLVVILTVVVLVRLYRFHYTVFPIRQLANLCLFMLFFQLFLGTTSFLMTWKQSSFAPPQGLALMVAVGHVATGMMIQALSVVMMLRSYRLFEPCVGKSADDQFVDTVAIEGVHV